MTESPTGTLVERAAEGDQRAFGELIGRYDPRMRGLAYRLLAGDRHAMDDALQDAYLKAYLALPRFRRDADPGTWLRRIVFNACMDELRRRKRRPEPVDAADWRHDRPSRNAGPARQVSEADATLQALRELPLDQRATLVLVDGEGFDNQTAARILGVAPGTVGSRLSRARARVRQLLGEENR